LVLIAVLGWFFYLSMDETFTERLYEQLETGARIAEQGMPDDEGDLQQWVDDMFQASGYRITVIQDDGVVLADSHTDAAVLDNHASRPEVAAALAGETGRARRVSESTGFDQLYLAIPAEGGVLRLSAAARDLVALTSPYRTSIVLIAIAVGFVGLGVVTWLARRVSTPIAQLTEMTLVMADDLPAPPVPTTKSPEIGRLVMGIQRLDTENRARLREAERASSTLEVVLGALPQGTILLEEDDSVAYANPAAYELLGVIPDSLSGLAPFPFQAAVRECRETRSPVTRVVDHGRPVRMLLGVATPFAEDLRALLVVVDVTDRERAAAVRRDFVANASHELKTPVASIIASSEALQMAVVRGDDSSIRFARQIEDSAHQLDRLVTDLLDLSRLERDQPELDPLSLDLLLKEEVERIRPLAEKGSIALNVDVTPVRVAGSRRDVAIAIRNLLDNAVRYTGAGGTIRIELKAMGEVAVLKVEDSGVGIPTRDLGRVFERFYRVDAARSRATGGTGLGLAIVKHVVESHGGEVEAESELGVGSVFTVRLPVLEEESPAGH